MSNSHGTNQHKELWERFKSFLETPKGKKFLEDYKSNNKKKIRAQQNWSDHFKKHWLKTGRFDEWMKRMIAENGEDHIKSEYDKGHQPGPTSDLSRTFTFAQDNASKYGKVLTSRQIWKKYQKGEGPEFCSVGWVIKGYAFIVTDGQGTFFEVYDPKGKRVIALG